MLFTLFFVYILPCFHPFIYLLTYLMLYLLIYLSTNYLSIYLRIYLPTYLYIPIYLLMKKNWSSNVVKHIDKKIHWNSEKHLKSIWYYIVLQSVVVVWWPKHWCETKETKVQSLLPTYTMWSMYIHIYTLYMCVNV